MQYNIDGDSSYKCNVYHCIIMQDNLSKFDTKSFVQGLRCIMRAHFNIPCGYITLCYRLLG